MIGFSRLVPRAVLVLIATIAFVHRLPGQERSPSVHPIIPVIGTVKSISGNQISVESGTRIIAVATDDHTEVWKGKIFHDLSLVHVGDDFAGRCRADASGRLVADLIELNVVNFFGIITKVDGGGFEMLTNPNADPQSGYVKKKLKVTVDSDTLFSASAKEDLKAGPGRADGRVGPEEWNHQGYTADGVRRESPCSDGKREGVAADRTTEIEVTMSRWL